jgi:two-component system OmpR family response regulator
VTRHTVLLVEDSKTMRLMIREFLEGGGYTVFAASTGAEALNILRVKRVDVILLDRTLPDADGIDLISSIRQHTAAPVLIVSGKGTLVDKVVGLELGADDYLEKPFEMDELLARVKARIRRFYQGTNGVVDAQTPPPQRVRFGNWILDSGKYQAFDDQGKSAGLSPLQFHMLVALATNPGRVMTRSQLRKLSGADTMSVTDRAVDVQIARIRRKICGNQNEAPFIKTVSGIGYTLECEVETLA